jgi:RNA-directed DNA polymerase
MDMTLGSEMHQKSGQPERDEVGKGEAQADAARDEARPAWTQPEDSGRDDLLRQALSRENMAAAWKRVKANKGSAGVDGLSIEQTGDYLKENWPRIRQEILSDAYRPKAVRGVEIPKPMGGKRNLGIPTVLDRLIQQALLQVLQPLIDPTFSEFSYGFRPGRSAHDAVQQAQQYVQDGYRIVVDVDLEKFFDMVNHDILMDRLAKRIDDKASLRLIRRYLQAGNWVNGEVTERTVGTPQGGPLSPLLANVMLDEVDKELKKRGHRFVRYADDCNVYLRSQTAGERVLRFLKDKYAKLGLRVNDKKTEVGVVFGRKFLGYCFRRWIGDTVKVAVATKAIETFKQRIRAITRRNGGRNIVQIAQQLREYLPGWKGYFRLAETPKTFRTLDSWLRRRLRAIQLKLWRRGTRIYRGLLALGAIPEVAAKVASVGRRWWRGSRSKLIHLVLTVEYFDGLGIPRLI